MSTADHAERPLRPPGSASGGAPRAPYADGGSAGGGGSAAGDGSALRRMAEAGAPAPASAPAPAPAQELPTAPIPLTPDRTDSRRASAAMTTPPAPAPAVTPRTTAPVAAAPVAPPPVAPTPAAPTPAATDTARHAGRGSAAAPADAARTTPARPEAMSSSGARPASVRPAPRRVRLTVSRVDPWSAMKVSFLLSVALGIAGVVMVFVLWTILAGMGVFDQINGIVGQVVQDGDQRFDIMDFIGLGRVVSLAIVIGVIDVILITAIATLGAFLYNVSSALVGGIQLTLTDD